MQCPRLKIQRENYKMQEFRKVICNMNFGRIDFCVKHLGAYTGLLVV